MTERAKIYKNSDGIRKTLIWDSEIRDSVTVKTEQDLTEILDGIARDRDVQQKGDNRHVARLPTVVYEDLVLRGIANDETKFKAWLNSSEATPWRVWWGQL